MFPVPRIDFAPLSDCGMWSPTHGIESTSRRGRCAISSSLAHRKPCGWRTLRRVTGGSTRTRRSQATASSRARTGQKSYRRRYRISLGSPAPLEDPSRLERWAAKGRAVRFEHTPPASTLVEHAVKAVSMCTAEGADLLHQQLLGLDLAPVSEALSVVPYVECRRLPLRSLITCSPEP